MAATKHQPWHVQGDRVPVTRKWDMIVEEIRKGPIHPMFENKSVQVIRSYYDCMLKRKRESNALALKEPAVDVPPLEGLEAEVVRCRMMEIWNSSL